MAVDGATTLEESDGWTEATDVEVTTVDLFANNGATAFLTRFQATQPSTTDKLDGIIWNPGDAESDFTLPGGAATRVWVWAAYGRATFYIKQA